MKKFNWGTGLVIGLIIFLAFPLVLLYITIGNRQEIVIDDYYPRELKHQEVIDKQKNFHGTKTSVTLSTRNDSLAIRFPNSFTIENTKGHAWFYAPADKSADLTINLLLTKNREVMIPLSVLKASRYIIKLDFISDRKPYYTEIEWTKTTNKTAK
jgi:hypothetical protein